MMQEQQFPLDLVARVRYNICVYIIACVINYTYAYKENMNQENEKKAQTPAKQRKPLTKKQKVILISVASAVAVVLVVVGVVLGIMLGGKKGNGDDYKMPSRKIQYEYYIDHEDTVGFKISDKFREDVPLTSFTKTEIISDGFISLSNDLLLKVEEGVSVGYSATYNFSFRGVVIAVVNVIVVDADEYIHTATDLINVSTTQDKTYIVRNDLDLSGVDVNISRFIGSIHFNHHQIKNYNASNGGLFKELNGATITGLDLVDVTGSSVINDFGNFGVIVDYASNGKLRYCSVQGEINVTSTAEADDILYLGGFVGYASALKRKNYLEVEPAYVHLISFLNVKVAGSGDFRIGGVVGGVKNATLNNLYNYGKITFDVSESQVSAFKNLYLGGIIGALTKEYDVVLQTYNLDESSGLYSYGDLDVDVLGGGVHNNLSVGGIFGYLENHSIVNCIYGGKMDVNLTRATLKAGGIVGVTDNNTTLKMNVRGIIVKGEMNIYSLSTVYAGGIIGEGYETQYSSVEQSIEPTINTDKSKVQGTQVSTSHVANSK